MPTPLYLAGKRAGRSPIVATAASLHDSLLFLCDSLSSHWFLVDTGAEISILSATGLDTHIGESGPTLKAANGSSIKTYGVCTTALQFGPCRFKWNIVILQTSLARCSERISFEQTPSWSTSKAGAWLTQRPTLLSHLARQGQALPILMPFRSQQTGMAGSSLSFQASLHPFLP